MLDHLKFLLDLEEEVKKMIRILDNVERMIGKMEREELLLLLKLANTLMEKIYRIKVGISKRL
mgnify:CR=1 FL=1